MLKINRKLSQKGFTLIEIMVALAILAIAALGIFQAYTTGFQAMADSKYRTVATNIAQKKLEEVKNSVKVLYPYYELETQEVNDKTFTVIVVTNSIEDNLEQVYVTVSWTNRKGNEKNVQLETLVYDLKTKIVDEPDVGRIHLSADPTVLTCCVEGETSTITAELFTPEPEQRVPSGTPVRFNVDNGSVDPEFTVTNTIGKATTQLTLSGKNTASVTANSGTKSSVESENPLEISCVPKASKIVLSALPSSITPEKSSEITATVTDTCGDAVSYEVTVEFITNKGTLSASEDTTNSDGKAFVTLSSMADGDIATVTGTITIDEETITDSTTIICTYYSISVTADPTSINPGGSNDFSTITATLTQSGVGPVQGENISFATDIGTLSDPTPETTNSSGQQSVILSSLSGGEVATITASYTFSDITISDTTTVQCTEYIINIEANPDKVIPGSRSTITATLTNYLGNPASNRRVDFSTTGGVLSDVSVYTNSSGIAITTLTLNNLGDVAEVSATFGFASDFVNVECIEFILVLTADPITIIPGGISEITATLTNYEGEFQNGADIIFNTDNGYFTTPGINTKTVATNASGVAVVHLTLNTDGITAVVTAKYVYDDSSVETTVSIECSETYITLNDPHNITHWRSIYSDDSIDFDLYLHGGPLTVDKVKIVWETDSNGYPSKYRRIWIREPIPGGNQTQIYYRSSSGPSNNSTIETLNRNFPYKIPANSSFRISIQFSYTIRDKHVIFTFNPDDPNAENYQVEFKTPN